MSSMMPSACTGSRLSAPRNFRKVLHKSQLKPNPKSNLGVVTIGYVAIASQNGLKTYDECLDVFMTPDVDPFEHDRLAGRVDRPEVALPAAYRFDGGLTLPGSPELLR
jgi:hypothetical protein